MSTAPSDVTARLPRVFQAFAEHSAESITVLALDGTMVWANDAARAMMQRLGGDLVGKNLFEALPLDATRRVAEALDALAKGPRTSVVVEEHFAPLEAVIEYTLVRVDDVVVSQTRDVTGRHAAAVATREAALRAERLQRISAALSRAVTEEDVIRAAVEDARTISGAGAAFFGLVDGAGEHVVLTGAHGLTAELERTFARVPLDAPTALATIVREGTPLIIQVRVFRERFPHIAPMWERAGYHSGAGVPLVVGGERLGAFGMLFREERAFSVEDQQYFLTLGELCGQALQRARLYAASRAAEAQSRRDAERLRRLGEVSRTLADATLDHDGVLAAIAQISSDAMGDPTVLRLLDEDGETLRIVATAASDPAIRDQQRRLVEADRQRPATIHDGVGEVVRTGVAVLRNGLVGPSLIPPTQHHAFNPRPLQAVIMVPLRTRDGVRGVLSVGRFDAGRPYSQSDLTFMQEIADRAGVAVQKTRLYREARDAVAARDDFLSVAGHELRTPLTGALLHLAALERQLPAAADASSMEAKKIVVLRRQLTRLQRLVDRLLDVSRISSGRLALDRERVDLVELTRDILERTADEARVAQCELRLHAAQPVVGEWDRLALDSVVSNLVGNALRYGGGKPVDVTVDERDGLAVVEVRDQGIGIPQDQKERVFQKFERAVPSRSYAGFGLGLWISRQIVELHGGNIDVHSAAGEGARMVVRLPRGS